MELEIERMVHGGVGLARAPGGRLVLVRGAIPGELVRAGVEEVSGVLRGEVAEVLRPSPDRLPAGDHPGLDYGHIRYERQLELKREVVVDALRRSLRADPPLIPEVVSAPQQWGYRSTVQPVVLPGGLGYRRPGTDEGVLLEEDPVANEAVRQVWGQIAAKSIPKGVREIVIRGNDEGEALVGLVASAPQRSVLQYAHDLLAGGTVVGVSYARFDRRGRFRGGSERLAGTRQIGQRYGDFDLTVTVSSFAQPNPEAAGGLFRAVRELAGTGDHALELFAGSGAIAFHLAASYDRIEAVEIDRSSVARGRADAARLGLENVEFVAADARKLAELPAAQLIAVDPPRSGLAKELREAITRSAAARLLYVSCDPATWARDVADLAGRGWQLVTARPYDFYPHTHHIEMLSLLQR